MKNSPPPFDPQYPWLVKTERIIDDVTDLSVYSQHCCERAAEERARYLRAMGTLNVSIERQRPVPRKGMSGNWRIEPSSAPKHVCGLASRVEALEDLDLSPSEMRLITVIDD